MTMPRMPLTNKILLAGLLFLGIAPATALRRRTQDYDELDAAFDEIEAARVARNVSVPLEPIMSNNERGRFYWYLQGATNYLEFGSGGTTIAAIAHTNIQRIHTVESDPAWIAMLMTRADVREAMTQGRLNLIYADIGPVDTFGRPSSNTVDKSSWTNYSSYYARLHDEKTLFDLILIDGHFRVSCMLRCLQHTPVDAKVEMLVHDYWNTPIGIHAFVDKVDNVDSLENFHKKKDVNEEELARAADNYSLALQ